MRAHTESSIKRREPTLIRLVATYKTLCEQISHQIRSRKAPRGAQHPVPIPREGLFQMTVDDEIWNDIGLVDEAGAPPEWLANEDVRLGIRLMLEVDRCEEELRRLRREMVNLQDWGRARWEGIVAAEKNYGE